MPIRPPALDDRAFHDLVDDVLARLPAHVPEYTNPRPGDPGRTLIELFAWLTDTLLYRANLIPERQRLAFLRLLGAPLRPAAAARGIVSVLLDEELAEVVKLAPLASVKGPVAFETRDELSVLPLTAEGFFKRPVTATEREALGEDLLDSLLSAYGLRDQPALGLTPKFYVTTPIFSGGAAVTAGFDLVRDAIDGSLWLALLAPTPALVASVRTALGTSAEGQQNILSVGVVPSIDVASPLDELADVERIPHVWELSTGRTLDGPGGGQAELVPLERLVDGTAGLSRRGVLRLGLPASTYIGAPENDARQAVDAGLGDRPPRIDDAKLARRLVAWLRLRPLQKIESLRLSWVGINAVEIDQRQTTKGRIVGQSNGNADQELQLPGTSVEPDSLQVEVEETGVGYVPWTLLPDLALAGRDAAAFQLDSEAGTLRFGDGVRGRIPDAGRRVRVARMRAGGTDAGNLPAGVLREITANDLRGGRVTRKLKLQQTLPTEGGRNAETLAEAEQRIPGILRHRERAVTADDFKRLAAETPGVSLGRVELLPRFKPQQRRFEVPGVVSVLVLPFKAGLQPPNPRADRPFLEAVHAHLDQRRALATELYAIGCEYVPLAVSVGVSLRDGFPRDEQLNAVKDAIRRFFWPLIPGGFDGTGWALGRAPRDREVEVVVAQVPGVSEVRGVNLFERRGKVWSKLTRVELSGAISLPLEPWQLPELLAVAVVADAPAPDDPTRLPNPFIEDGTAVAVPVVPEVC
jgi:predicted phage baseplate assembly protein